MTNDFCGNKLIPAASYCYEGLPMGTPEGRRALEQLVEDFYVPLYRYAYRLAGCATGADDLTQETFCKAQANFQQLRDPTRAKAWLFRILRNAYLQSRREAQH